MKLIADDWGCGAPWTEAAWGIPPRLLRANATEKLDSKLSPAPLRTGGFRSSMRDPDGCTCHIQPSWSFVLLRQPPIRDRAGLNFEPSFPVALEGSSLGGAVIGMKYVPLSSAKWFTWRTIQLWRVKCQATSYHPTPVAPKNACQHICQNYSKETRSSYTQDSRLGLRATHLHLNGNIQRLFYPHAYKTQTEIPDKEP